MSFSTNNISPPSFARTLGQSSFNAFLGFATSKIFKIATPQSAAFYIGVQPILKTIFSRITPSLSLPISLLTAIPLTHRITTYMLTGKEALLLIVYSIFVVIGTIFAVLAVIGLVAGALYFAFRNTETGRTVFENMRNRLEAYQSS